jgi:hypothetical protein
MIAASKRALDARKDFLKPTLDLAFEIFTRGIVRKTINFGYSGRRDVSR